MFRVALVDDVGRGDHSPQVRLVAFYRRRLGLARAEVAQQRRYARTPDGCHWAVLDEQGREVSADGASA